MIRCRTWLYPALLFAGLSSVAVSQPPQDPPPNQPFRAVHMMTLTPTQAKEYIGAVQDFNSAIVKQGCPACVYHVFKVTGQMEGKYNYMQFSDWPGSAVYTKIHNSDDFKAAGKRHGAILDEMFKTALYNRFVEVKAAE
jgi:hypothetical protein